MTLSEQPNAVTDKARRRKERFQRWFVKIFNFWYRDVTEASNAGARQCLTDNFPNDSPGNLDKESVFLDPLWASFSKVGYPNFRFFITVKIIFEVNLLKHWKGYPRNRLCPWFDFDWEYLPQLGAIFPMVDSKLPVWRKENCNTSKKMW